MSSLHVYKTGSASICQREMWHNIPFAWDVHQLQDSWPLLSPGEVLGGHLSSAPFADTLSCKKGWIDTKIKWPILAKAIFFSSEMDFCNPHSLHWELPHWFHITNLPQPHSLQNLCSLREVFSILPNPALPNPSHTSCPGVWSDQVGKREVAAIGTYANYI